MRHTETKRGGDFCGCEYCITRAHGRCKRPDQLPGLQRHPPQRKNTVRDLEIAYEYARINVTMVEESQTPMIELFLLDRQRDRMLDMQIMELRNRSYPECSRPLSRAEVYRAVMHGAPTRK